MNFNEFFKNDLIVLDKSYSSKEKALESFAKILVDKGYASDKKRVVEMAMKREAESSTGIGEGIAIPHIRDDVMKESVIFFARVNSMDWDSLDGQPVNYVFFIALNPTSSGSHVEILAALMKLFMNEQFKKELEKVKTIPALVKLMNKFNKEEEKEAAKEATSSNDGNYDIVAVTACPTGIAHTFMARDMLEKAAKEMNIKIKVETQGADGAKNVLTDQDIKNAKGVLIACDRVVELSKFSGHPNVLEMGTKPVIKDAKKEIQKLLDGQGVKFEGNSKQKESSSDDNNQEMSFNGFGKRLYKSLMTGVSYMLPFVVFGGILIAIAFLFDMANSGQSDFGSVSPAAKWFKTLGDLSFGMMVPIIGAYITFAIVGRQGLLPGFIVGLMAQGKFLFSLNPETGVVDWFTTAEASGGGSSGIFGAIVGAFLAAAILIALVKYVFVYLPAALSGIKNILIIPLFGTLAIATAFWIVNIPMIYVNYGFTKFLELMDGRPYLAWLLGMIIGAMMAVDLGGPINKAAYVFSITSLEAAKGEGTISMAAAMAGGMTPPIGIALCCTFFKKMWTDDERKTGMLNYIMGLTFISEGAIPFTLSKPKVIIPANVIGGAITGLLIGALGVRISAPHGGILTVALCKTDYMQGGASIGLGILFFIAAIVVGSVVEMFFIVLFNKIFSNKSNNKKENNVENKTRVRKSFARKSGAVKAQIKNDNFNSNLLLSNQI
ncbi:MAG: PTS transporter subunit EIIA [Mycoplasma sp.]|nr:PTS transporter subunit EIIA [Mycoplasma sp.]